WISVFISPLDFTNKLQETLALLFPILVDLNRHHGNGRLPMTLDNVFVALVLHLIKNVAEHISCFCSANLLFHQPHQSIKGSVGILYSLHILWTFYRSPVGWSRCS